MTIGFADFGNSPGRGTIGGAVDIYLDEWGGDGRDPDDWFIEAWTHTPHEYDHQAVEEVRRRIREILPRIAVWWEEFPEDRLRR